MEQLNELRALLAVLREHGVVKYSGAGVSVELGAVPAPEASPDLNVEGFVKSNGRSPELNEILGRLDPQYSDPALFDIRGAR